MDPQKYTDLSQAQEKHWWYLGRKYILETFMKRLVLKEKPQILEIGSGTGGNIAFLERYGALTAIEPDPWAREFTSKKTGLSVRGGQLPHELELDENEHFDLICMFDVLEHVEEDFESLVFLKEKLQKDGQLFLTVPAFMFLWGKHDERVHHKRRYTKKQLTDLLQKSGYRIETSTYFNIFLFPLIAAVRVIHNKIMPQTVKIKEDKIPPSFLNKIFYFIFKSEGFFLRFMRFPFGVSLLVIAEKA